MSFEEIFSFAADTETDVLGIYAAGNPIGFTVLLKNDVCGYIYFLAIEGGDRAKGYGSAALRKMMVKYAILRYLSDNIHRFFQEAFVRKYFSVEICWIVMIATNKHDPVVSFGQTFATFLIHILIIA